MDSEPHLRPILRRAWEQPFTARSMFTRENAELVLRAVELGYLTLRRGANAWTNLVRLTPAGLAHLNPLHYPDTATQEDHGDTEDR